MPALETCQVALIPVEFLISRTMHPSSTARSGDLFLRLQIQVPNEAYGDHSKEEVNNEREVRYAISAYGNNRSFVSNSPELNIA